MVLIDGDRVAWVPPVEGACIEITHVGYKADGDLDLKYFWRCECGASSSYWQDFHSGALWSLRRHAKSKRHRLWKDRHLTNSQSGTDTTGGPS